MNWWTILAAALLGLFLGIRYRAGALLAASIILGASVTIAVVSGGLSVWLGLAALAALQAAYLAGLAAMSAFTTFRLRNRTGKPPHRP